MCLRRKVGNLHNLQDSFTVVSTKIIVPQNGKRVRDNAKKYYG